MKILALDLGTSTGFAHNLTGELQAGTWLLGTDKEISAWGKARETRKRDPRVQRLFKILSSLDRPDIVVFEDVQFASYTKQAQLWPSYRTAVWLAFGPNTVLECVPVKTLKKFATGNGNADKEQMAKALYTQQPELKTAGLNDDAIDAIWIYSWAVQTFRRYERTKN